MEKDKIQNFLQKNLDSFQEHYVSTFQELIEKGNLKIKEYKQDYHRMLGRDFTERKLLRKKIEAGEAVVEKWKKHKNKKASLDNIQVCDVDFIEKNGIDMFIKLNYEIL